MRTAKHAYLRNQCKKHGIIEKCIGLTDIGDGNMLNLEQHESIVSIKKILQKKGRLVSLVITKPTPTWHREICITFTLEKNLRHISWKLVQNPAGCGTMILKHYTGFSTKGMTEEELATLQKIIDLFIKAARQTGVGVILTVLGHGWMESDVENIFLKKMFKFEELLKYNNHLHGEGRSQKLYSRIIK